MLSLSLIWDSRSFSPLRAQQAGQERGAIGQRADDHVLMLRVPAIAHDPKPIQGRHTQGGSEVAVRSTAGACLGDRKSQLSRNLGSLLEERHARRGPHHRRTIDAARDLHARTLQPRLQATQGLIQAHGLSLVHHPHID